MNEDFYYTAPSDELFDEVKAKAIEVWGQYDNEYGYVDEKVGSIKDLKNIKDNFMYMVAMFDQDNQQKLSDLLSKEARLAIRKRMVAGGHPDFLIVF